MEVSWTHDNSFEMSLTSYSYEEFISLDVFSLNSKIESLSKEFENGLLWEEINLFERIMSRISQRLPNDRCLNRLLKLRRFLKRLQQKNIFGLCSKMSEAVKNVPFTEQQNTLLPTGNDFSYFLFQFQKMAWYLARVASCCEQSSGFLLQKLQVGHVMDYLLLLLALISRIYTLSKIWCIRLDLWYKQFFSWMEKFKTVDSQKIYEVPQSLKEWMQKETNIDFTTSNSEIELNDEFDSSKTNHSFMMEEDIGEAVGRNEERIVLKKKKKMKTKNSSLSKQMKKLQKVFFKIKTLENLNVICAEIKNPEYLSKFMLLPLSAVQNRNIDFFLRKTSNEINKNNNKESLVKKRLHKCAMKIFNIIIQNSYKKKQISSISD